MPLKASQQAFAAALLDPDAPVPGGIVDPEGRPAPKRFAVYRNNVTVSLVEALTVAFPVIEKIVGSEFFAAVAREYVRLEPPASPLLMFYGSTFPNFLAEFEPTRHLTYLPDVARLEQMRRHAYHAADVPALAPDFLATIAPEALGDLRVTLHPSVQILCSEHPVWSIWHWNMADDQAPGSALPDAGEQVLVSRPDLDVEMRPLPPGGSNFLTALQARQTLNDAAAAGAGSEGFDLTQNITGLLESRIVTDFTLDGAAS